MLQRVPRAPWPLLLRAVPLLSPASPFIRRCLVLLGQGLMIRALLIGQCFMGAAIRQLSKEVTHPLCRR